MRSLVLFLGGAIGGYLAILFGWIAYADAFAVADNDGGKVMSVAFTLAPLGGTLIGAGMAKCVRRGSEPPMSAEHADRTESRPRDPASDRVRH